MRKNEDLLYDKLEELEDLMEEKTGFIFDALNIEEVGKGFLSWEKGQINSTILLDTLNLHINKNKFYFLT